MLLSRILGGLGRFFISLGVITLLFVAYQLWGTGLLTAQAQNALEDEFEEFLAEAEVNPAGVVDNDVAPANPDANTDNEPEPELTREERRQLARLLWRPNGKPVARIFAPEIDLEWTVVAGVGSGDLEKGPGHYTSTPLPGMPGNASIAGHRTTWGAPFNRIDELDPGDEITVETAQGVFVYEVIEQDNGEGFFIVSPDRVDVLDQDFVEAPNRLTLTACHPKFSAAQRIIVVAELVGEPAPYVAPPGDRANGTAELASEATGDQSTAEPATDDETESATATDTADTATVDTATAETTTAQTETGSATEPDSATTDDDIDAEAPPLDGGADDFGEGLDGDSSAILPSITWGLAAFAIWGLAAFAASRWRRWPAYGMSIVPFAIVLFVCFVHIDQALPSY